MVVGECARIWQVQSMRQAPGFVIPRSEATWESPAGSCDFADGFPTIRPSTARLPRLLRSLAMTSQGGFPHPEGRNDKPESASLPCHSEERSDVGISSRHYRIRRGFPVFRACTARLPRLLRSLAMTSQGGFPHPEGRNDKPESASLPCHCEEGASPTWQSQVGTCEFAGAFLCSGVYCEIATAPAEPRNDKSGGLSPPGGAQ